MTIWYDGGLGGYPDVACRRHSFGCPLIKGSEA
jgi:hypothetical protein